MSIKTLEALLRFNIRTIEHGCSYNCLYHLPFNLTGIDEKTPDALLNLRQRIIILFLTCPVYPLPYEQFYPK